MTVAQIKRSTYLKWPLLKRNLITEKRYSLSHHFLDELAILNPKITPTGDLMPNINCNFKQTITVCVSCETKSQC